MKPRTILGIALGAFGFGVAFGHIWSLLTVGVIANEMHKNRNIRWE